MSESTATDFSNYTKPEIEAHIRKAVRIEENQTHIVKASASYARLAKNKDFNIVMEHLRKTVGQLAIDLGKRNAEAQQYDNQVIRAISTTLNVLEDLPAIGSQMSGALEDTKETLAKLRAQL